MHFHEAIKQARTSQRQSKAEVARALNLPYTTYDSYERGYRNPPPDVSFAILAYFCISLEDLTSNDDVPSESSARSGSPQQISKDFSVLRSMFFDLNASGRACLLSYAQFLAQNDQYRIKEVHHLAPAINTRKPRKRNHPAKT